MDKKPYIFKCQNCGANKVFSPKHQTLLCPHCGTKTTFEIYNNFQKKPYYQNQENSIIPESDTEILTCTSCGANLNMIKGEISKKCPFCGTGNIVVKENMKGLKPDECVPFTIEPFEAESSFKNWLKKKWFIPNELKRKAKAKKVEAKNMKGIYSPCYAFDSGTFSTYSGVLGKHYTTTVGSGKNRRTVTKTRYFRIKGQLDKNFIDVMTECSPHFNQKVLDKIRPFTLEKRANYDKSFLSGFSADSYDKDLNTGWNDTKYKIDSEIKRAILSKYSYDVVQSLNVDTSYSDIKYSYMLLPVYVSGFRFKEKIYNFFVNGNTGKTYGKVPRSPIKIAIAILIGVAIVVGGLLLYNNYIGPIG